MKQEWIQVLGVWMRYRMKQMDSKGIVKVEVVGCVWIRRKGKDSVVDDFKVLV